MAVAAQGEKVTSKGLVFAAIPASDFICGTQQLTSMNLHVFTTGEGSPYGLALVPVVKVSSRTALAERWPDLIDVDAGRIATGNATIEEVGWGIFRYILDVASGHKRPGRITGDCTTRWRCSIPGRSHDGQSLQVRPKSNPEAAGEGARPTLQRLLLRAF